ncbi:acylneuraminate cytidylyltransferase family protein [Dongshaea marina]|uniref:acylneuraminate cytidylyltransferase family protein n=1 Tax=Dongshaea marina TaxID=2047966 RepID=UPI003898FC18
MSYSIEAALNHPQIEQVIVSTDSQEIAQVALEWGAQVPFIRPAELATDTAPELEAWQHAIRFCQTQPQWHSFSTFISLPATAPLRSEDDVTRCLELFGQSNFDLVVTGSIASRSPWFNMVKKKDDGAIELVLPSQHTRRQDTPQVFDLTTVAYVSSPQYILNSQNVMQGRIGLVEIPRERAIDIDEPLDFEIAECLLARRMCEQDTR